MQEVLMNLITSITESGTIIILGCIIVGTIIKKWVPDTTLQNKYIPTVNTVIGGILGILIPGTFPDADLITQIIYGALCGIVSSVIYDKTIKKEG